MPGLYSEQLEEDQVFGHSWTRAATDDVLFSSTTMNPATCRRSALTLGQG